MSWSSPLPGQPALLRWALTASTNSSGQPNGASIATLSAPVIACKSASSFNPCRSCEISGRPGPHSRVQALVLAGCAARSIPSGRTWRWYSRQYAPSVGREDFEIGDGNPEIAAAGGVVLTRDKDGQTRVAVIHRPKYMDWSLPKGKLEEGE